MYKNQLQELAQRSCFNLPSYTCIREGPDHAPRFKAIASFNGESFESPHFFSTLRQAEHAAAEVALNSLSARGPPHSFATRILDETGVYKNLLQEIAQRVGAPLPQYATFRSGLGHQPVFTGIVELAGITFTGEPAKNKKQAEKNAAMAAWSSLKQLAQQDASSSSDPENNDEQEQIRIARALLNYRLKEKMGMGSSTDSPIPFQKKFPTLKPRPSKPQHPPLTTSKILPLICPKTAARNRATSTTASDSSLLSSYSQVPESRTIRPHRFPAAGATPYVPVRHFRTPYQGIAPPVTVRRAVPVYSAPPVPPPSLLQPRPVRIAPPISIRQAVPVFAAPPVQKEDHPVVTAPPICIRQVVPVPAALPVQKEDPPTVKAPPVCIRQILPVSAVPIQKEEPPTVAAPPVYIGQVVPVSAPPVQKEDHATINACSQTRKSATQVGMMGSDIGEDELQLAEAVNTLEHLNV